MDQMISLAIMLTAAFITGFLTAIKIIGCGLKSSDKPLRQYIIMRLLGFRDGL